MAQFSTSHSVPTTRCRADIRQDDGVWQRGRLRARWFVAGLVLAGLAVLLGVVGFVLRAKSLDAAASVAQLVSLLSLAPLVVSVVVWARGRTVAAQLPLERAADELAEQLRQLWESAATERGLRSAAIDLRWEWSHQRVTGPVTQAVAGAGGTRFAPLPGIAAVTAEQLRSGFLGDLHLVYGGLDSGRLVILGAPGAGKSGAAIRLLLDALKHRSSIKTIKDRFRAPVPVLLTVHGWDPSGVQSFKDWLMFRLVRDNDLLRAPAYGRDTVIRLIEGGHLAVILDGLDEMPEPLRQVALRALDEQATFRLVVLTRSEELVKAVSAGRHLQGAAALELCPVGPEQAAKYLESCQLSPLPGPWRRVVDHLNKHPGSALAQALDTPLMLTLVRDIYYLGDRVDELTNSDSDQFATREAIENHLLAKALPAAYTQRPGQPASPYTVDQAQKWLGALARSMNDEGTRDLAWWQVSRRVSVWPRALFTACLLCLAYMITSGLGNGILGEFGPSSGFLENVIPGVAFGLVHGPTYALLIGLGYGLVSMPNKRPLEKPGQIWWSETGPRTHLTVGFVIGFGTLIAIVVNKINLGFLGGKFIVEFSGGLGKGLLMGVGDGLVKGLVIGLGFMLAAGFHGPWSSVRNRTRLPVGLAFGLFVGLLVGLVAGLHKTLIFFSPVSGLVTGLYKGLISGLGYGLVVWFGRRLPLRPDRLLWNRADLRTILIVGLVIYLVIGFEWGLVFLLVVGLGGRRPRQLSRPRWTKTNLRTDLIVGLGGGLATGLILGLTQIRIGRELVFGYGFGLQDAFVVGLVGLLTALLVGLGRPSPDATSPVGPRSLWRRELGLGAGLGLVIGVGFGILIWWVKGSVSGLAEGVQIGLGAGLVSSATWSTMLASAQLWRRGQAPVRLVRFLEDARTRNILRTVGPLYQFRHARLQDWLAETTESLPMARECAGARMSARCCSR